MLAANDIPHGPFVAVPLKLNNNHLEAVSASNLSKANPAGCPDINNSGSGIGPLGVIFFGE